MDVFAASCVLTPPVSSTVTTTAVDTSNMADLAFDTGQNGFSLAYFDPPVIKKEGYEEKQPPLYDSVAEPVYVSLPPYPTSLSTTGGGMVTTPPPVVSSVMTPSPQSHSPSIGHPLSLHHSSLQSPSVTILYEHKGQIPESSVHCKPLGRPVSKNGCSDQQFTAADSNSNTPPKSFVPCKVCGDKASGYHYGVTSCEGCKGESINDRFFTAKFQTSVKDSNVICCYVPNEDEKDRFYGQLRDILNSLKKEDITLVLGDFNAKVGTDSDLWGGVIGPLGIDSCNGQRLLQGFFRRSIQKQIEYRCLRDGKCLVIRLNRNRCQYCRFKKCLAVGMSRDSVRYGRVPKRSRERNEDSRVTQSEADQSVRDQENKQLAMYDIILTISQAHHANCAYTEEKTRGLVRKPAIFSLNEFQSGSGDGQATADSLQQQKIVMWQHFAVLLTPSIQRIVEFAKRVPGFLDLTQDDQLILIKLGFFEIWLVHVARMVNTMDSTLTFSDGSYISRQQMELMFDQEFVSLIFNFVVSFNNMQLNDTEIGLYSAVVLLTSERSGIYDHKAIEQQQEKLMEALKLQVGRNHPSDPHVFATLVMKLPELRTLGRKHMDHLAWFRGNWVHLKLPPLFAEVFDIPKSEQDLVQ